MTTCKVVFLFVDQLLKKLSQIFLYVYIISSEAISNFKTYFHNQYKGTDIMNSCQLSTSITAVANALASTLSIEETSLLAAIFVQLGDTLATIATQRTICVAKENACKN